MTDLNKEHSYKLIEISNFDNAQKFKQFNTWCTSHFEDDFKGYKQGTLHRLFYLLRDDYNDVRLECGENYPADSYGLSMILVLTDSAGKYISSATRWNELLPCLNPEQIKELTGFEF